MTSQHTTVVSLDIETVPDREAMAFGEIAEGVFPPPPCHKVVAISMVVSQVMRSASHRHESYRTTGVHSGGRGNNSEEHLLRGFWDWIGRAKPRVVTWNGRRFDIQVLKQRAMMYGLQSEAWHSSGDKWDNYNKRYSTDWHCDLGDAMSDFGASKMVGLDLTARSLGFPGKIGGHGSEVEEMVNNGQIDRVRAYCEGDVLNLHLIYLRWALFTGVSTPEGHNAGIRSVVELLERERDQRPHFGEFLEKWRASTRPYPFEVPVPNFELTHPEADEISPPSP